MQRGLEELKATYPSLALFSDFDWESVSQEFASLPPLLTFPEYLQQKAEEGDCPHYIFELAYYEYALQEVFHRSNEDHSTGLRLNPTAVFLNLEFDVSEMIRKGQEGCIEILERPHVLCLFKNIAGDVMELELDPAELKFLSGIEENRSRETHSFEHLLTLDLVRI